MSRPRGANPGPTLAVVDGEGLRETRSGARMGAILPPTGTKFEADEQALWDQYIAENPYLDAQDGWMASMWCSEAARFRKDPRGMSAADKSNLMKMAHDLYLSAAERNRRVGVDAATSKKGAASRFLSKRKE